MIEEFESLSAIYPDTFEVMDEQQASNTFECKRGIVTLLFTLPLDYPLKVPTFFILTSWPIYSAGAGVYEEMSDAHQKAVQSALISIHLNAGGEPCLFECIEFVKEYLEKKFGVNEDAEEALYEPPVSPSPVITNVEQNNSVGALVADLPEIFTCTSPITERKSIFLGHCVRISSSLQIEPLLAKLRENKRISKASHPHIYAYTVINDGITKHDCDDDGESGAGGRLLHLLQFLGVNNCLVIVTRWFGGVLLGAVRFKLINNAARQALKEHKFIE
jgi:hypothetical protein